MFLWVVYESSLRPNPHWTRTRNASKMEPAVVNGSVHTARNQHQRNCPQICVLASSVDWLGPHREVGSWPPVRGFHSNSACEWQTLPGLQHKFQNGARTSQGQSFKMSPWVWHLEVKKLTIPTKRKWKPLSKEHKLWKMISFFSGKSVLEHLFLPSFSLPSSLFWVGTLVGTQLFHCVGAFLISGSDVPIWAPFGSETLNYKYGITLSAGNTFTGPNWGVLNCFQNASENFQSFVKTPVFAIGATSCAVNTMRQMVFTAQSWTNQNALFAFRTKMNSTNVCGHWKWHWDRLMDISVLSVCVDITGPVLWGRSGEQVGLLWNLKSG